MLIGCMLLGCISPLESPQSMKPLESLLPYLDCPLSPSCCKLLSPPPDCAYSSLFQAKGVQPAWHARAHHGASSPRSQVKGFQVAPAELEAKLLEDPCITDACVVGVPHERHGQVPKAFVVARAGTALATDGGLDGPARVEAVLAKLRPRLAEYKVRGVATDDLLCMRLLTTALSAPRVQVARRGCLR